MRVDSPIQSDIEITGDVDWLLVGGKSIRVESSSKKTDWTAHDPRR